MQKIDLFAQFKKNDITVSNQSISFIDNNIGGMHDNLNNSFSSNISNINPNLVQKEKENNSDEEIDKDNIPNITKNYYGKKINKENNDKLFSIIYIFPENEMKEFNDKISSIQHGKIEGRYGDKDNISVKIKRSFFNGYLYRKVNYFLKSSKSRKEYKKYGQNFIGDIKKDSRNKELWNSSFENFCLTKDFCDEKDLEIHKNNLDAIQSVLLKKNEDFQNMLKTPLKDLYKKFIDSNEFKIDEIYHLINQGFSDAYLKKYNDTANNFIERFTN